VTEVTRAPQIRATHHAGWVQRGGDGPSPLHGLYTASTQARFEVSGVTEVTWASKAQATHQGGRVQRVGNGPSPSMVRWTFGKPEGHTGA